MRIGIFEGKKAYYNRMILKVLIENKPMKAWSIAKEIAKKGIKKTEKTIRESTQDIYSILIRKNGRLNELLEKKYIMKSEGFYFPTLKGIIAVLVSEEKIPKIGDFYHGLLSEIKFPEKVKVPFFDIEVNGKKFENGFKEFAESLSYQEGWIKIRSMFKELLESGIDLDRITDENVIDLLQMKIMEYIMKHENRKIGKLKAESF